MRIPTLPIATLAILLLTTASAAGQDAPETAPKQPEDPFVYGVAVPTGAAAVIGDTTIPATLFFEELVAQQLRAGRDGGRALETLIDEQLIGAGLKRRNLAVEDAEIDEKMEALDRQMRAAPGGMTLEKAMAEQEVPMAVFRRKLERVVALEKLARRDLPVPDDKPVENWHMNAWLQQAKEGAKIVRAPNDELPRGIVARIGKKDLTAERLGRELMLVLDEKPIIRAINVLLEEQSLQEVLKEHDLKLAAKDFDLEWNIRKADFQRDPKFKGVDYEDVLVQQTGLDATAWRKTREFRIATGRGLLARAIYEPAQLQVEFQRLSTRYGPIYEISHILLRATDQQALIDQGKLPSKDRGLARMKQIREQIDRGMTFIDAAKQFSQDRGSQLRGGELPAFTPGRNPFEPALFEAVKDLAPGTIAEPVWTRLGWHLVLLRKISPVPPMDASIESDLRRYLVRELFAKRMQGAKIGWNLRRLAGN